MTTDLERFQAAVAASMREVFETDRDPDRWAVVTLLSQLGVAYDGPRVSPSTHEEAVIRLCAASDVENLTRLYPLFPDTVRAYVLYAYVAGGYDRLKAIAVDGPEPDEVLVREALEKYDAARRGVDHVDAALSAGVPLDTAPGGVGAWRGVAECAQLVPKLAGTLDRLLAERRRS